MKLQLTSGISKEVQMESMSKHRKTYKTTSSYSWTKKQARSTGVWQSKSNHQIHRLVPIRDRWQLSLKRKVIIPTERDTKGIRVAVMITIDIGKMAITAIDRGRAALTIVSTITTGITTMVGTKSPSIMKEGDLLMTET